MCGVCFCKENHTHRPSSNKGGCLFMYNTSASPILIVSRFFKNVICAYHEYDIQELEALERERTFNIHVNCGSM